ncbi:unnamed protein product [Bursaphelenchus xylophilus]|uniref:(pine wood nematode) hypothetical protein n=1 Tax=Bursaphelenchus xylophilus TaxID=6326 RepID=A0A1I7SV54_BURXY|nr:unnamed protein product [Bursaphelenchus xylophilus]CAG9100917.1 unnamed protein product [Bursaphelenchus xylophilus]
MNGYVKFAVLVGFVTLCLAHPQFRVLKCRTQDGQLKAGPEQAHCNMIIKDSETELPGREAPEGDGCFYETVNGEERLYCDLVCPKAHTVFNAHIEQGHKACFNFYTYQLERRGQEWYIWRSGKCLNSTATFTVGCKFDEPFNTQFANDNEVFARLAARRVA